MALGRNCSILILPVDNKLFDAVSELKHELLLLTIQNEKLKQEGVHVQNGTGDGKNSDKASVSYFLIFV